MTLSRLGPEYIQDFPSPTTFIYMLNLVISRAFRKKSLVLFLIRISHPITIVKNPTTFHQVYRMYYNLLEFLEILFLLLIFILK